MAKDERLVRVEADLKRVELGIKKLDRDIKNLKDQVTKQSKDLKEILVLLKFIEELATSE